MAGLREQEAGWSNPLSLMIVHVCVAAKMDVSDIDFL